MVDRDCGSEVEHVHGSDCRTSTAVDVFRCLECEMLFESGISDSGAGGGERCPQCGLQNARAIPDPGDAFVIRRTSPFR